MRVKLVVICVFLVAFFVLGCSPAKKVLKQQENMLTLFEEGTKDIQSSKDSLEDALNLVGVIDEKFTEFCEQSPSDPACVKGSDGTYVNTDAYVAKRSDISSDAITNAMKNDVDKLGDEKKAKVDEAADLFIEGQKKVVKAAAIAAAFTAAIKMIESKLPGVLPMNELAIGLALAPKLPAYVSATAGTACRG